MSRPSLPVAAILVTILVGVALLEGAARLIFMIRDDILQISYISRALGLSTHLDPYEIPAPYGGYHWVLKPGYRATMAEFVAEKKRSGRVAGVRGLLEMESAITAPDDVVFRINSLGFKGPELDRDGDRVRILAVGDSTTFGIGVFGYPQALEAELNKNEQRAEVINAGIEGYTARNILLEMDRYRTVKPDFVMVYVGWNTLFSQSPTWRTWERRSRAIWLARRISRLFGRRPVDEKKHATRLLKRPLHPRNTDPGIKDISNGPLPSVGSVERLVDEFEALGAKVILVTLPGLFTTSDQPTAEALEKGHLPEYTDNPFVLAALTERYNEALRALAGRRSLPVVDLERWTADALRPRHRYFSDAVHLTTEGLRLVGYYMAERLESTVDAVRKRQASSK